VVTDDLDAARAHAMHLLDGGHPVVLESYLDGPEVSLFCLVDGPSVVPLLPAQDFKRVGDGDTGPNTGGMGAYSPVPLATEPLVADIMDVAVLPTLAALADRGIDYRGVLYAGLMLTDAGPKVLEFNVRFGDPETQVVMSRWPGDVAGVLAAAAAGRLDSVAPPAFSPDASVCVVLASPGYPEAPRTGQRIAGLEAAQARSGVQLYSAGVGEGLVTAGGRVLGVTGSGPTLADARTRAYDAAAEVSWPGMHFRTDIAATAISEVGV
jgi:phosphoribosylamine--glycine ligase